MLKETEAQRPVKVTKKVSKSKTHESCPPVSSITLQSQEVSQHRLGLSTTLSNEV